MALNRPRWTAALAFALPVALLSGSAAGTALPTVNARNAVKAAQVQVPPGQTTTSGMLPPAASSFDSANTGWTSYGGAGVAQTLSAGHAAPGALAVTSAGGFTGAASPAFTVTPGARYSASAWLRSKATGHQVGLALQFRDASGAVISAASQLGQTLVDNHNDWSQTAPVVGFAPSNAASANVVFLDYDGPAGDLQGVDDVAVTRTVGVAAKVIGPLTTQGPNILDANSRVVHFRGIDIDGLQYSNQANVTTSEVAVAQSWGANFVRLPLAENYVVPTDCSYDSTYLSKVDAMVNAATASGMFIMLDLHTNGVTACTAPKQQLMPDPNSVTFWKTIAARYKSNPLVGFDLYNEPHDVSDRVWHFGGTVSSSGVTYSAPGMQTLYGTVRGTGATNLVFASGTGWATGFPDTMPLLLTTNLVYAAHAYTCPNGLPSSGATCTVGPDGTIYDPSGMLSHFATVSQLTPVMVTEFGFPDRNDGRYISNVINYAAGHNFVGWDVYAFDGFTSGLFDLWRTTTTPVQPTPSGMAVMTGMLGD
ncbi:MAG: Endoglucanase precursor [Mycobacterium sp.]|nr:Endoglucanase precursor [Mycobacterium sp.]